jgi:hypothetical protein
MRILDACDSVLSYFKKSKNEIYITDKFTQDYVARRLDGGLLRTHGYHFLYEENLKHVTKVITSVELGSSIGSAMVYRNLFNARQISLDIRNNNETKHNIEFLHFDETLEDSYDSIFRVIDSIDFFVDDALHDRASQMFALTRFSKKMSDGSLYVVEENKLTSHDISLIEGVKSYDIHDIRCESNYCNSIICFIRF